jgi:hypothetical protein
MFDREYEYDQYDAQPIQIMHFWSTYLIVSALETFDVHDSWVLHFQFLISDHTCHYVPYPRNS